MLVQGRFSCKKCGYAYNAIVEVDSEENKTKLMKQQQKCPSCGNTMESNSSLVSKPYFSLRNDAISFLGQIIFYITDEGNIRFNADAIMNLGFCGKVELVLPNGKYEEYEMNSLFKKLKKINKKEERKDDIRAEPMLNFSMARNTIPLDINPEDLARARDQIGRVRVGRR